MLTWIRDLFHIHKWTNWKITKHGDLYQHGDIVGRDLPYGYYTQQTRVCTKCNYVQIKKKKVK